MSNSKLAPTLIVNPPKSVLVNQKIVFAGQAPIGYAGKEAKLVVDKYALPSATVEDDGSFYLTAALNQAGQRRVTVSVGDISQSFPLFVSALSPLPPLSSSAPVAPGLYLSGSVGAGGKNSPADVAAVQRRLKDLGYAVGEVDGKSNPKLVAALKLFQSIIQGRSTIGGDGRVDPGGVTHKWLDAVNAPIWMTMSKSDSSISYRNQELEETHDHHDYGASWLAEAILWIAKDYHQSYRSKFPKSAPFTINDVSLPHGGNTPDHAGHETGLQCDVFLPRTDGAWGLPSYTHPSFDRAACRAMILSIRRYPLFKLAYFNDPALIREGLCVHAGGHHHHIHFEIKPPARRR
jgi:hypothetical protein